MFEAKLSKMPIPASLRADKQLTAITLLENSNMYVRSMATYSSWEDKGMATKSFSTVLFDNGIGKLCFLILQKT